MANSNGKKARINSGLNRFGLKKQARKKRADKRYNDFVMTRDKYNSQKS
jgi:hypothetical protein